ncbi:beta-fructosidase, levanase/invertase [Cylindrospermum stagnale PCC 7417]|uniref:Beta-fructosidase, levanase/invertase n=1 Tax=Cylindrospermum stagnale PCC 7417 TaxID=56107 RepID=K9WT49_9NOST|nr:glycoside hydrolase family 68 protein [Cylindrospermum stagnale]AFZ22697.1 beta-fructosidase, levanase/invertase [Cylindrospermum stagnale PCC 7417]
MKLNSGFDQKITTFIDSLPRGRNFTIKIARSLRKGGLTWDPWILRDGDIYRLFYLGGPKAVDPRTPWWAEATIYGAISSDMKHWQDLGVILEPDPKNPLESQRMLAGSTYQENGIYYLFYSAAGKEDMWNEEIGLATSTDGIHWQRQSSHPIFVNLDERDRWYGKYDFTFTNGETITHRHWRDPYIVKEEQTGKYYMFICAAAKELAASPFCGCVALAVADSIAGPYTLLSPACMPILDRTSESIYIEMERPQVIYQNGKYHLFFSCWPHRLNPKWIQQVSQERISPSSLYWYVADEITGPFKAVSKKPVVMGSEKTGMYGTNFFPSPNNSKEFIAIGWYHNLLSLGVSPSLFPVFWNHGLVEIK